MIPGIVYTSNSGYTAQYARLLGAALDLPVTDAKWGADPHPGRAVIYLGWLMAGKAQGYAKAAKEFDIRAVCTVGMGPASQAYLLDTYQKCAVGGTGITFDWALIDRLQLSKPFLLAGGLGVDNIAAALATVRPYGVDANSGLEDAPGHKNHDLVRRFIAAVRAFEAV